MRTEELPSLYQQLQRKQNQGDEIISILVCLSHLNNPFTFKKSTPKKIKTDKNHGVRYERFIHLRPSSGITTGRPIACVALLLFMGTKQSI